MYVGQVIGICLPSQSAPKLCSRGLARAKDHRRFIGITHKSTGSETPNAWRQIREDNRASQNEKMTLFLLCATLVAS